MQALRLLFLPSGRLPPRAFGVAVIAVYLAGAAVQWLTVPAVISRVGFWPFAGVQAALIWIWYVLHAKRLHDAGRPAGLAMAAALLYALSIVLLVIVAAAFFPPHAGATTDANTTSALGLILLIAIMATLVGAPSYDLGWFIVTILIALAFVPVIVAVAVTLWAATRPSGEPEM